MTNALEINMQHEGGNWLMQAFIDAVRAEKYLDSGLAGCNTTEDWMNFNAWNSDALESLINHIEHEL